MPEQERPLNDADVVAPLPEPGEGAGGGEPTTINLGGKGYQVASEIAKAFEEDKQARERDYAEGVRQKGEELGEVRRELAEVKGMVTGLTTKAEPKSGGLTDDEYYEKLRVLTYEDPVAAEKLREERIADRYALDQARRYGQQLLQRHQERLLDGFYKQNPDLEDADEFVDATFQRLRATDLNLQDLLRKNHLQEVFKIVADETRKKILQLSGRRSEPPKTTKQGGRMAVAEGGGGPTGGSRSKPSDEEDEGPKTMAEAIKMKQARHKGAHTSRPPGTKDYRPRPTE